MKKSLFAALAIAASALLSIAFAAPPATASPGISISTESSAKSSAMLFHTANLGGALIVQTPAGDKDISGHMPVPQVLGDNTYPAASVLGASLPSVGRLPISSGTDMTQAFSSPPGTEPEPVAAILHQSRPAPIGMRS